jgi:hypothetical protein
MSNLPVFQIKSGAADHSFQGIQYFALVEGATVFHDHGADALMRKDF